MAWDKNERRYRDRREGDTGPTIGRDDLYLLLESYRNTVEYSTTVLERQEAINEGLQRIMAQVVAICETQGKLLERINGLPADLHQAIDDLCAGTGAKFDQLTEQLRQHGEETYKDHQGHRLRLYGAYVGMVTIILGLLGLLAKIWPGGGP